MTIKEIHPHADYTLHIVAHDGGYFIEWEGGADLSADTIEARWQVQHDHSIEDSISSEEKRR